MPVRRSPPKVRSAEDLLLDFEQTGDPSSFEELVRRYSGVVYGVCYRVTRNAHDAEDSTQAVFLKLALQARTTNGIPHVGAWLQRVARTTAMDLRRGRIRRLNRELARASVTGLEPTDDTEVDDALRMEEVKELLRAEVDELPPHYRTPLILFYFGGLSADEIAKELGSNAKALAVRLFRGRKMLAGRLKDRGVHTPADCGAMMKVALGDAILAALADAVWQPDQRAPRSAVLTLSSRAAAILAARVAAITRICTVVPRPARWALGLLVLLSFSSAMAGSNTPLSESGAIRRVGDWVKGVRRALDVLTPKVEPAVVAAVPPTQVKKGVVAVRVPGNVGMPSLQSPGGSPAIAAPPVSAAVAVSRSTGSAVANPTRSPGAAQASRGQNPSSVAPAASPRPQSDAGIEISATRSLLAMGAASSGSRIPTRTVASPTATVSDSVSVARFPGAAAPLLGPEMSAIAAAQSGDSVSVDLTPIEIAPGIHSAGTSPVGMSGTEPGDGGPFAPGLFDPPDAGTPHFGAEVGPGSSPGVPEPAGVALLGGAALLLMRRERRKIQSS
jgi:RNA polymerase sigma factor (sigma-70 family)